MTRRNALLPAVVLAMAISGWVPAGIAAQASAPEQSAAPARSISLPSGTTVLARLQTNVDVAKAKAGDPVDVQIMEDVKSTFWSEKARF
jgi:hypothetical protein